MTTHSMIRIGISTKSYLGYAQSRAWLDQVTRIAGEFPAVRAGQIRLFLAPTFPILETAVQLSLGNGIDVAAQDMSRYPPGAYTGEVPATFLAELGVSIVELGHAERRGLFHETDASVTVKAQLAHEAGLLPLLCVGEPVKTDIVEATRICLSQATPVLGGPAILAYEPVWAIGAAAPAPTKWIREVVSHLRLTLAERNTKVEIIYGGSAGPGLLTKLYPEVDGLFLGRFAHDAVNVRAVLDEASELLLGNNT